MPGLGLGLVPVEMEVSSVFVFMLTLAEMEARTCCGVGMLPVIVPGAEAAPEEVLV